MKTTYKIDPAHSSAHFIVRHMMITNVRGGFTSVQGMVVYDPEDLSGSSIDVIIDVNSLSTSDASRDGHLKSAEFLDVEKFATITFKSNKIAPAGHGEWNVTGLLTIHGVTKEVVLDVDGPSKPLKVGKVVHIGASTSLTINRKDYGMVYNRVLDNGGVMVGDEVEITLDIDLTQPAPGAEGAK